MDFSFQLYSARNFPPLSELLPKLKVLGYAHVEGYGGLYEGVDELVVSMKTSELSMPSAHFSYDQLKDIAFTQKIAGRLGISTLICPYIEPDKRPKTEQEWKIFAQSLGQLADQYNGLDNNPGLTLAWHNHDFEFDILPSGVRIMDVILQGAPNIGWQFDVAWAVKADENPIDWIKSYANRIVSVHVKDIAAEGACVDEDGWADLGEGVVDWSSILKALKLNTVCKSFVMEHDNPNDVMRFASRSLKAAKSLFSNDNTGVK